MNDEPPVVVLEQLFVQEGQSVTLTNTSIVIPDLDTGPGSISCVLETPPEHGQFFSSFILPHSEYVFSLAKAGYMVTVYLLVVHIKSVVILSR